MKRTTRRARPDLWEAERKILVSIIEMQERKIGELMKERVLILREVESIWKHNALRQFTIQTAKGIKQVNA